MRTFRYTGPQVCYDADTGAGAGGAGNPAGGADKGAGAGQGLNGGDAGTTPFAGLKDAGNLELVKAKGWTDPDAAIASYRELEAKVGKAVFIPDATADEAARNAFYDKLGRPKAPTEYKFEKPKNLPTEFPYDATAAEKLKTVFHNVGLSPTQAAALHDQIVLTAAEQDTAKKTAVNAEVTKAAAAITAKWGDPESPTYKRNTDLANRAIVQLGGDDLMADMKAVGIMAQDGSIRRPALAFALAKIGAELFAEDSLYGGTKGFANPFAAASEDTQAQGEIIRKDPARARVLMQAAGIDPAEYKL